MDISSGSMAGYPEPSCLQPNPGKLQLSPRLGPTSYALYRKEPAPEVWRVHMKLGSISSNTCNSLPGLPRFPAVSHAFSHEDSATFENVRKLLEQGVLLTEPGAVQWDKDHAGSNCNAAHRCERCNHKQMVWSSDRIPGFQKILELSSTCIA